MAEELENVLDKGESPPDDNLQNEGVQTDSPSVADKGEELNQNDNLQDKQIDVDEKGVSWEEREKELQRHEIRARELREKLASRSRQVETQPQYDNQFEPQYDIPVTPQIPVVPQTPVQPQQPIFTQDANIDFDIGEVPEDADVKWYTRKFAEISRKAAIAEVTKTIAQRETVTRVFSSYPDLANQNSPLFKRTSQVLQQYGNDPRFIEAASAVAAQSLGILPIGKQQPVQKKPQPANLRIQQPSITETGVKKEAPKAPQLTELQLKVAKLTKRDPKNIAKYL